MFGNLVKHSVLALSLLVCILSFSFWIWNIGGDWDYGKLEQSFPYTGDPTALSCSGNTDLWNCTSVKEKNNTIIVRLLKVFGLDDSTEKERDLKFIDYARAILNMALGLVAFIALIMTIYTFYMMFFSENEAWIKKAKWSLIGIFIALGVIWLAWLIVSFIFWWYQANWKQHENDIETWDVAGVWEFYYE